MVNEKTVEIEGKAYTLRMTRAGLRKAESVGLDIQKLGEQPITQSTYLFMAALYGGGVLLPDVKAMALADKYFDEVEDVSEALAELAEMYSAVFRTRE